MSNHKIDKIYFMVHPVCYSLPIEEIMKGRPDSLRGAMMWCCQREKEVRDKQDELIRNLKQNEVLVLYPIGRPGMLELEEFVRKVLDKRCVILPEKMPGPRNLDEWSTVSSGIKVQIADEIVRMHDVYWNDWQAMEVKVIIYSSLYAEYIRQGFQKSGLVFDPKTVEAEAFGESFDGCVTTWTNMTASFLGLKNPVEKNYELSVPDIWGLITAKFVERITLGNHFSLYLWEDADGTPIGLFAKGSYRSYEPRSFAVFPLGDWHVTVRRSDDEVWPEKKEETKSVKLINGIMHVAVHTGSRRWVPKGDIVKDVALCIFGHGVKMTDFRERLLNAEIVNEKGG